MIHKFHVELISIGNELLAGYTINTNVANISRRLQTIGLQVRWTTVIADQHDDILYALRTAGERADIVLVTGGLGPTPDDITKRSIAEFFNVTFIWNDRVLEDVIRFLAQRGREISETNKYQAYIPDCDTVIYNEVGTAPGLVFSRNGKHYFFMPGVPVEMQYMMDTFILKYLQEKLTLPEIHTRLLRTTGIPESRLYESIRDLCDANPQFPVAFLPRHIGVDLRFRLVSADAGEFSLFQEFVAGIHDRLQKYVFTDEEIELEQKVGELLRNSSLSLSVVESFTGGLLSDLITNVPGSSDYFMGGVTTYSNQSKQQLLGVSESTFKEHGAVSGQTVSEMVRGAQKLFGSECAIATTGIAGPGGATVSKPVGLCYLAARVRDRERVKEFRLGTQREINKKRGATAGLEMLRRLLLDME